MIPGLDGIRALGIMLVIDFHAGGVGGLQKFGGTMQAFFVLSGFLITGILLRMKETLPKNQFFGKFYGRRFLRIFPAYYLYLFLVTILIWSSAGMPVPVRTELQDLVAPQIRYSYLYISNFHAASLNFEDTPFLTHFWTLSMEEQFYLLWPIVLFLTPKENFKRLLTAIIVVAPLLRLVIFWISSNQLVPNITNDPYVSVFVLPFSHIDAFALGAYVTTFQFPQPRRQLAILAIALPAIGYVIQYFSYGKVLWDTFGYEFAFISGYKYLWGYSLINYFFALFIQAVVHEKLFVSFLNHPALNAMGKMSYGMYIFHYPIIWLVTLLRSKYKSFFPYPDLETTFIFLTGLALTLLVSSISYRWFENPINNLKDRWFPIRPEKIIPLKQTENR
ncbi:MAG: acyltransferase [Anaerolineaceae bacterium]|nr:MAG: acyltransferase [Anaerolineaceae bacterium]